MAAEIVADVCDGRCGPPRLEDSGPWSAAGNGVEVGDVQNHRSGLDSVDESSVNKVICSEDGHSSNCYVADGDENRISLERKKSSFFQGSKEQHQRVQVHDTDPPLFDSSSSSSSVPQEQQNLLLGGFECAVAAESIVLAKCREVDRKVCAVAQMQVAARLRSASTAEAFRRLAFFIASQERSIRTATVSKAVDDAENGRQVGAKAEATLQEERLAMESAMNAMKTRVAELESMLAEAASTTIRQPSFASPKRPLMNSMASVGSKPPTPSRPHGGLPVASASGTGQSSLSRISRSPGVAAAVSPHRPGMKPPLPQMTQRNFGSQNVATPTRPAAGGSSGMVNCASPQPSQSQGGSQSGDTSSSVRGDKAGTPDGGAEAVVVLSEGRTAGSHRLAAGRRLSGNKRSWQEAEAAATNDVDTLEQIKSKKASSAHGSAGGGGAKKEPAAKGAAGNARRGQKGSAAKEPPVAEAEEDGGGKSLAGDSSSTLSAPPRQQPKGGGGRTTRNRTAAATTKQTAAPPSVAPKAEEPEEEVESEVPRATGKPPVRPAAGKRRAHKASAEDSGAESVQGTDQNGTFGQAGAAALKKSRRSGLRAAIRKKNESALPPKKEEAADEATSDAGSAQTEQEDSAQLAPPPARTQPGRLTKKRRLGEGSQPPASSSNPGALIKDEQPVPRKKGALPVAESSQPTPGTPLKARLRRRNKA